MSYFTLILMLTVFGFSLFVVIETSFAQVNDNKDQFFGSNDLEISELYNSSLSSLLEVVTHNINNYSSEKIGTAFVAHDTSGNVAIITSSSLVSNQDRIVITTANGNSYDSKIVGSDPISNLAVLSSENISDDQIIPLNLTNSSKLYVGQTVSTIGTTTDFTNLFNTGIISGLDKSIPSFDQNVSEFTKIPNGIITNLELSTGYGGGPLLDIRGDVIGMVIQNYSTGTSSMESTNSFAIPSNTINKIIPLLLTQGYYLHPWLGVSGADITPDIANILNLTETRGFLVIDTTDQSPADKAGILGGDNTTTINGRPITLGGDIILKVDDKEIQNIHDILTYIENEKNVGDNIVITVLRNGILQSINVLLQPNPNFLPGAN